MDHSRNHAQLVYSTFGDRGSTSKLYVYDEVGRLVTVTSFTLSIDEIENLIAGVRQAREDKAQGRLWEDAP